MLHNFVVDICGLRPDWTPQSIIDQSIERIRQQVGGQMVLSAVSGGVDSSVATALVQRAIGDQLVAVFVDTGMLRQGEAAQAGLLPALLRIGVDLDAHTRTGGRGWFDALGIAEVVGEHHSDAVSLLTTGTSRTPYPKVLPRFMGG